jgi:hypothetical protein
MTPPSYLGGILHFCMLGLNRLYGGIYYSFDVMFSANSSPRAEGASPPSPRSTDAQKQLNSNVLQLHASSCS